MIDRVSRGDTGAPGRDRSLSGVRLSMGAGLLGVVLTGAVFASLWISADRDADRRLESQALTLVESTSGALDTVDAKLVSLSGLFRASITVTPGEFEQFTGDVGLEPGMSGIGFLLQVDASDLDAQSELLSSQSGTSVSPFEMDADGARTPVGSRPEYYLVQHVSPGEQWPGLIGFDLKALPVANVALTAAVESQLPTVTPFFDLPGQTDGDNFVVFQVVSSPVTEQPVGVVVALMDFSELLEANVPAGIEPYVIREFASPDDGTAFSSGSTARLDHSGSTWLINVAAVPNSPFSADREGAYVALGLGLLASFLAVLAVLLIRERLDSAAELAAARQTTDAKDRFIAAVSHELRTPLTAVLGFAEILRDGEELSDEERVSMMKAITEEATDLAHIIDDLLVAARGEIGQLVVTRAQISLRDEVGAVVAASGLIDRIAVIGPEEESAVAIGDPNRVRQILRNLMENAGRYGGGRIEIELVPVEDEIRVEVRDDGSGVPASVLEAIFERYQHFGTEIGVTESLGLGLNVSSQLAHLMDGELSHERRGGWTVFSLTLPAAQTEASEADLKWAGVSR